MCSSLCPSSHFLRHIPGCVPLCSSQAFVGLRNPLLVFPSSVLYPIIPIIAATMLSESIQAWQRHSTLLTFDAENGEGR